MIKDSISKRLFSLLLSVLMVVETGVTPGLSAMTGYASESSGDSWDYEYDIKAAASLPEKMVVKYGTTEEDLKLPKSINLLVRTDHSEFEEKDEDDTEKDSDTASSSSIRKSKETKSTTSEIQSNTASESKEIISESATGTQNESSQGESSNSQSDDTINESTTGTQTEASQGENADSQSDDTTASSSQAESAASASELESTDASDTETTETKASQSETKKDSSQDSKKNKDAEFITKEQLLQIENLLSSENRKKSDIMSDIKNDTGLDLSGYEIVNMKLSWECDETFGGYYNPEEPADYTFTAYLEKYPEYSLERSITVKVLPKDASSSILTREKNPEIPLTVYWEDGGIEPKDKSILVKQQNIEDLLYLEYFIEDVSEEWKPLDLDAMKNVLGYAEDTTHVPSPSDAESETLKKEINNTTAVYKFTDSLYDSVGKQDPESGEIISHAVKYRISAKNELGNNYFSKHENENGEDDENGTVLRNYKKQIYTATIKWNDAAKTVNGENPERPSKEEWLKHIHLYKAEKGSTQNATEIPILSDEENKEGSLSIADKPNNEWSISIPGYGYDKDNYPIHYYITEDDIRLNDDYGSEGNEITNRHYSAEYKNEANASDRVKSLYTGGTLVNSLTGETSFTVQNEWLDDAEKDTIDARPTISIKLYRYAKDGNINDKNRWSNLSPIQDSDYVAFKDKKESEEGNTDYKHYSLSLPEKESLESLSAYNSDGAELIYAGKVQKKGGTATYKTSRKSRSGEAGSLHQDYFVLNGETIVNLIEGSVLVKATKTWKAAARQDVKSEVDLAIFRTTTDPEKYPDSAFSNAEKLTKTMKLDGFISEVQKRSTSSELPKYDENGNKLYYIAREERVATARNNEASDPEYLDAVLYTKANEDNTDKNDYYILTYDGYRYIQSINYGHDKTSTESEITAQDAAGDQEINITNTLIGDAEIVITKEFSSGLLQEHQEKGLDLTFNVYQNNKQIGTVKRRFENGKILDSKGNVVKDSEGKLLDNVDFTGIFSTEIQIKSFEDLDEKSDSSKTGLLPRYDEEGVEYKYTADEQGGHGYSSTVHNSIEEPERDIKIKDKTYKEKYLLSKVKIVNSIGEDNHISVYKEWLDGGDSVGREPVTFVLEAKKDGTWTQISEATINPASENYTYIDVPQEYKDYYKTWRENKKSHTENSEFSFRVRETYVGSGAKGRNKVYSYGEDDSSVKDAFSSQPDVYTAFATYKQDIASQRTEISETEQYGFVKGNNYIYDVHVRENDGTVSFDTPQSFDFVMSNLRIGYVYFDVNAEKWTDGVLKEKARPDGMTLEISSKGRDPIDVPLTESKFDKYNWKAGYGPYRKYDENGKLIDYNFSIKTVAYTYYQSREDNKKDYEGAYVRTTDRTAVYKAFHTGDVYSFTLSHELKQNIIPTVNKYWEDDDTEGSTNKRPDIVMHLYRTYTDSDGKYHVTQLDKDSYIPYEWDTNKDKYHNWWQLKYAAQPRFSKDDYYEYTYYITETIPSKGTYDYVEIGAFQNSPSLTGTIAEYSNYAGKTPETLQLDKDTIISAARVSIDPKDASTIVNRRQSSRTVLGEKIYTNLPKGYKSSYLPKIKFELWRKAGTDDVFYPVKVNGNILTTVYDPATANGSTKFYFKNEKGDDVLVPKYDDKGRLYTYTIREVSNKDNSEISNNKSEEINESKLIAHVFNLTTEDTLTNGLIATNGYNVNDGYKITFYKKWDGMDLYRKSHDENTVPSIKVRLYRYLRSKDGIIPESEELVTGKDGKEITLKYDPKHSGYSSYTWEVPYYAPNLKSYFYVVSEVPGEEADSYGEIYAAEIKADSSLTQKGENLYNISSEKLYKMFTTKIEDMYINNTGDKVTHKDGFTGYDTPVNGIYSIDEKSGQGTAGFINVYTGKPKSNESNSSSKGNRGGNTSSDSSNTSEKKGEPEKTISSSQDLKPQSDTKSGTTSGSSSSSGSGSSTGFGSSTGSGSGSSISLKSSSPNSDDSYDSYDDSDDSSVKVSSGTVTEKDLKYSDPSQEASLIEFVTDSDSSGTEREAGSVLVGQRPFPDDSTSSDSSGSLRTPKTGDRSHMLIYGLMSLISLLTACVWFAAYKKKKMK